MSWKIGALWLTTLAAAFALGRGLPAIPQEPAVSPPGMIPAFEAALNDQNLLTRMGRYADAVDGLSPDTIEAARELLVEKRSAVDQTELEVFMLAWSRFDPAGAWDWAQMGPPSWRTLLESSALYAWGYREPKGAIAALDELDTKKQRLLRPSLLEGWVRSADTQGASDYVFSLEANKTRMPLVRVLLDEITRGGVDPAIAWADAIPTDAPNAAKEAAFSGAINYVTQVDGERASAWFEPQQSEPYAIKAIKPMAYRWIESQNPPEFFAWLETLEPGPVRKTGMAAGFTHWWREDPEAADDWIRAAKLSAAHDPAVVAYVRALTRSAPEVAIEWVDRLVDPELRAQNLAPVLRAWLPHDARAVRAWMDTHEVPSQVREKIAKTPRYRSMELGLDTSDADRRPAPLPADARAQRSGVHAQRGLGRARPANRAKPRADEAATPASDDGDLLQGDVAPSSEETDEP